MEIAELITLLNHVSFPFSKLKYEYMFSSCFMHGVWFNSRIPLISSACRGKGNAMDNKSSVQRAALQETQEIGLVRKKS